MRKQPPNLKSRLQALFFDYLLILSYLIILALVIASGSFIFLDGLPILNEMQSHWIAFLTTTLPVFLYFSWVEARPPYATFGKKRLKLQITYKKNPLRSSLIRNFFKFLPWHLGHYSVIKGLFQNDFTTTNVLLPYIFAVSLPILYLLMVAFRKDHRHLPDLLAHSEITKD